MSYRKYASPLIIELQASRRLARIILLSHAGALLLLWPLSLMWPVKLLLAAMVLGSGYRAGRQHIRRRSPSAVTGLVWLADGDWIIQARDGQSHPATLMPGSYLHPGLVVLALKTVSGRRHVVLLPDMMPAESFRRLRVRLRLEAGTPLE